MKTSNDMIERFLTLKKDHFKEDLKPLNKKLLNDANIGTALRYQMTYFSSYK